MRHVMLVLSIALLACCARERQDQSRDDTAHAPLAVESPAVARDPAPSHAPSSEYALTDTMPYTGDAGPGNFAFLRRRNVIRDSADVQFGIHPVGVDSLLYWPVEFVTEGKVELSSLGPALLIAGQLSPLGLREIPYLTWPYSKAIVVDSALFYWGVDTRDAGGHLLYASRYDFPRHAFASVSVIRTNDPEHIPPPRREGAEVVFQLGTVRRTLALRATAGEATRARSKE